MERFQSHLRLQCQLAFQFQLRLWKKFQFVSLLFLAFGANANANVNANVSVNHPAPCFIRRSGRGNGSSTKSNIVNLPRGGSYAIEDADDTYNYNHHHRDRHGHDDDSSVTSRRGHAHVGTTTTSTSTSTGINTKMNMMDIDMDMDMDMETDKDSSQNVENVREPASQMKMITTTATSSPTSKSKPTHLTKQRKRSLLFMDHESISLALRLTCEMNRRFAMGIDSSSDFSANNNLPLHDRDQDQSSVFYTVPSGRMTLLTFVQHVMKALDCYYHEGDTSIDTSHQQPATATFIPALALIYLERACSEESVGEGSMSSEEGIIPSSSNCPHLNGTNVHKLFLTAMVLASRTFRNEFPSHYGHGHGHGHGHGQQQYGNEYDYEYSQGYGYDYDESGMGRGAYHDAITGEYVKRMNAYAADASVGTDGELISVMKEMTDMELAHLLEWMVSSLGGEKGLAVDMQQMDTFIHSWRYIFDVEK